MNSLVPWLSVLAVAAGAFLVGKYFQREERKQRELRKKQMVTIVSSVGGVYSAAQAMRPSQTPEGLGSLQEQTKGQRFPN
jgi:hypothetical protein